MAYDSRRGEIVVFGGRDGGVGELCDTWRWDGLNWTEFIGADPPDRSLAPMVYAADRDALVLHGGSNSPWGNRSDTWEIVMPPLSAGDVNCDCGVNALDIEPFILALFDPLGYKAAYPECDLMFADINSDGAVNALDIEPFIDLLFSP